MIRKLSAILLICFISLGMQSYERPTAISSSSEKISDKILAHLNNPPNNYVMVASHRGDWRNAPENSIQAIKNCIKMGVDIVEIDISLSKDSVLVLMHDASIDRTTTGKGKVSEWTLDSLKSVFLKNGLQRATLHQIPTLEEAMLAAKGKILINLDKCSNYMDLAYQVLEKTGTTEQVIFKGTGNIDHVRKKYGDLLDKIIYMPVIGEKNPHLDKQIDDFLKSNKTRVFEVIYNVDDSPMFEAIETIKKNERHVWVNTLWKSLCGDHYDDLAMDDPNGTWGWVIKNGADVIQTDRPELLLKYLREKGLHD